MKMDTNVALPIKLPYFKVKEEKGSIILQWATIMEENFSKFIVQRSANGFSFEDIGEVPGKGFNIYDIQSRYFFEDEAPLLGFNYYRLKAVGLDASFEYFGVEAIKLFGLKKLFVYPNPTTGTNISFRTNFAPSESDRIILLDQTGAEIFNARANSTGYNILFQNKLPARIYSIRYVAEAFRQTARIVVKD